MNLNDQIKRRMDLFGLHIPYSIRMLPESDDLFDMPDEKVELRDGQLTFHLTPENSIDVLNELVAKASMGYKYGELLCSQSFNANATKQHIYTFYNTTAPLVNAFAFKEMKEHLSDQSIAKEILEWKGYFHSISDIAVPDLKTKMTLMGIYVALYSNNIIDNVLPKGIQEFRQPVEILLSMFDEEPSAELLCRASDRIVGKTMRTMLVKTDKDKVIFCLQNSSAMSSA